MSTKLAVCVCVGVCVCVCVCVCECVSVCDKSIYMYTRLCACMCVCITIIYVHCECLVSVYVFVCVCLCVCVCVCVCVWVGAYSTSGDHHLPPPTKKPFLWVTTNEPEPYSSLPLCPLVIISCLSLFLSLFLSDLTKVIISCAGCVRYRQVSFFT